MDLGSPQEILDKTYHPIQTDASLPDNYSSLVMVTLSWASVLFNSGHFISGWPLKCIRN